jgi:hypothetical protein
VHASIVNSPISTTAVAVLIEGADASATGTCNKISGNTAGVNNTTAAILNFEKNWWGAISGPSGSGLGSGDTVSANVDYKPWNTDITCTAFTSNVKPVANFQSVSTAEDTAKAITLTGTDAEGSLLTYSVVAGPLHGVLTGTAPDLTYTPASNYYGSDSFSFKVNDGTDDSAPATVSITVTPVNDAPVITGQSALSTPEDTALTILLSNLTVTDVDNTYPTGFTLTVLAGTNYTFTGSTITPASNYNGTLTVPVKVNDGALDSNTFDLTVTVSAVNDAPVITGQSALSTNEDTALTVLLSDLTVTDVDNTYPTGFTLTVLAGTNYTFTGNTITPASNFNGTLTVPVKVNDGAANSNSFDLTVTVNPVNDAPVITQGASVGVTMSADGSPTPFSLTLNATDVDGDTITWSVVTPGAVHGTASANGTGASKAITYTPGLHYVGMDSFVVQVSDGHGGSATITVNVTITAVEPSTFTTYLPMIYR